MYVCFMPSFKPCVSPCECALTFCLGGHSFTLLCGVHYFGIAMTVKPHFDKMQNKTTPPPPETISFTQHGVTFCSEQHSRKEEVLSEVCCWQCKSDLTLFSRNSHQSPKTEHGSHRSAPLHTLICHTSIRIHSIIPGFHLYSSLHPSLNPFVPSLLRSASHTCNLSSQRERRFLCSVLKALPDRHHCSYLLI